MKPNTNSFSPGETALLRFKLSSGERIDALRAFFLLVYGHKRATSSGGTAPAARPLLLPLQTQFENGVHGDADAGVCHALFVVAQLSNRPGPGQGRGTKGGCKKKLPSRSLDRQTRHSSPSALFPRLRSCLMSRFPAPSLAIGPRVSDSIVRVFFRNYLISHRVTHGCHRTTIHFRSLSLFDSMSLGSPSLPS